MKPLYKLVFLYLLSVNSSGFTAISLSENVLVDSNDNMIYTQDVDGSLQAINIESGLSLWKARSVMKPLGLANNLLLVQLKPHSKGQLKLAYINAIDGSVNLMLDVSIPADVNARISQGMDDTFLIKRDNNNQLFWKYSQHKSGALEANQKRTVQFGRLNIDQPNLAVQSSHSSRLEFPKSNKATNLLQGVVGRQIYSENRQHVLLVTNDSNAENGNFYLWEFYHINGTKLADFKSQQGYSPFIIVGNYLIYTHSPSSQLLANNVVFNTPRSLIVYDLSKKKINWQFEITDNKYTGLIAP